MIFEGYHYGLYFKCAFYIFRHNRDCDQPFAMHLTNYKPPNEKYHIIMENALPEVIKNNCPEIFTEKCYTELFPKENLVYLSPDSRNLLKYNPNDIYIMGGLVDRSIERNASLAKAESKNIRHARLPLREIVG